MKLARFDAGDGVRLGVVTGNDIADVTGSAGVPKTMIEVIAGGDASLKSLAAAVENARRRPLGSVRLLAPLERPGKYLAIGLNYRSHAAESADLGIAAAPKQMWFNKQTSCLSGPFDIIEPGPSQALDYEVELAVIIGRMARDVAARDALDFVFGYAVANDVTARDWQMHSPTWTIGKSFDTHGPIGPWIVTADEIPDPHELNLRCMVNDEQRQASNTRNLIHSINDQIAYLSSAFTLEPGDILATGTPEGIGAAQKPPRFLKSGDIVRCEIEGIGAIENKVAGAA